MTMAARWCGLAHRPTELLRKVRVCGRAQHGTHGTWCGLAHGTWCVWACDQAARWRGLAHRPRTFREKSVCVGVHNAELMERGHNNPSMVEGLRRG